MFVHIDPVTTSQQLGVQHSASQIEPSLNSGESIVDILDVLYYFTIHFITIDASVTIGEEDNLYDICKDWLVGFICI